jgi:GGDEF domain-containing protein
MATDGITTEVGVTVGVSRARAAEAEAHDLIRTADQSMYSRKPTR